MNFPVRRFKGDPLHEDPKCWNEGFDAAWPEDGCAESDKNPYLPGTDDWDCWQDGWDYGKACQARFRMPTRQKEEEN